MQRVKAAIRRLLAIDHRRNRTQANMAFSFDSRTREIGIHDRGGYQTRNVSTAHLLLEAAHAVREQLAKSFSVDIFTGDLLVDPPSRPHFAYCAAIEQPQTVMIPDFVFWGWPEAGIDDYEATRQAILQAARREPEDPRLFWIGNPKTHAIRARFLELAAHDGRIHAGGLRWTGSAAGQGSRRLQTEGAPFVSLADHCRYRYLIDLGRELDGLADAVRHTGHGSGFPADRDGSLIDRRIHALDFRSDGDRAAGLLDRRRSLRALHRLLAFA